MRKKKIALLKKKKTPTDESTQRDEMTLLEEQKDKTRSLEGMIVNETADNPTRNTYSGKDKDGEKTILYLGELALGTKASDPRMMRGLAYFIQANDLDDRIGHVVIDGGLLPYIPSYYGVQNSREMMFLGNDWDKEVNDRAKLVLKSGIDDEAKGFIEKWVAYKITNTAQAVEHSRKVMQPLVDALKDCQWHYLLGEEDNKNTEALIEVKINDYRRIEENEERLAKLILKETTVIEAAKKALETSKSRMTASDGAGPDKNSRETIRLEESIRETETKVQESEKRMREHELALNAIEREKEATAFFRITKRQFIQSDEAELLRWMAKNEYNSRIYDIFPELKGFRAHSGNEVDLILDDVHIRIAHKGSIVSNTAGGSELKKLAQRNRADNRREWELPDVYVTAHGAEGFRHQPMAKHTENIVKGEMRETPEFCMDVQLPAFQSEKQLEVLRKKGLKNDHTKRWEKDNFASGAVFYTVKDSGEHEISMITGKELISICKAGDEIRDIKENLGAVRSKRKRREMEDLISRLEEEMRIVPSRGVTISDSHLGCPNYAGRPSNYDVLDAAMRYVRNEGLPDVLMLNGDMVHGILDAKFGSNEQYHPQPPKFIQEEMARIRDDHSLSALEKLACLEQLAKTTIQGIPITHISKQLREAKRRIVPFIQDVLENGGYVIVTSGNHYNKSAKMRLDEATDIVNLLDLKYLDHPKLKEFVGLGEDQGVGEAMLPNGWKVYAAHCPMRGSDNVAGAMKQMKGANRDADLAVFGDVHHCGGGYSDGTFVVICSGLQPWVPFVDKIGMQPSLRGMVNFEIDLHGKQWMKWKYVLDKTLESERYMLD